MLPGSAASGGGRAAFWRARRRNGAALAGAIVNHGGLVIPENGNPINRQWRCLGFLGLFIYSLEEYVGHGRSPTNRRCIGLSVGENAGPRSLNSRP